MNNQNYNNNTNPANDPYQQQQIYPQAWPQQHQYGYGYYQQPVQNFYPQQQPPSIPNFAAPPPPPPSQPSTNNSHSYSQNQEGQWQPENNNMNRGGYQNNRGGRGDNNRSQNRFRGNNNSWSGGNHGNRGAGGNQNNNKNNRGGGNSNRNQQQQHQQQQQQQHQQQQQQQQQFNAPPPNSTNNDADRSMFSRNEQASTSTASNDIFSTASAMFGNQTDKFIDEQDAAFMKQFEEWEAGFAKWRDENKNHPDKAQYLKYEDQFISVRTQLLARRNEMLRRKQKQTPPPKSAEQMKFESQWNAGDPQTSQQSNSFNMESNVAPNILEVQVPPSNLSSFNDGAVAPLLFGSSTLEKDFKNDSFDNFASFDDGESSSSSLRDRVFSRVTSIPGLDVQEPPTPRYSARDDIIDLDYNDDNATSAEINEKKDYQFVLPSFTPKKHRSLNTILNIGDILDDPSRANRPDRILLIIRGASGSGKSHLANLILNKETENKNERCRIIEPRGRGFQAIFGECMDLMREGYINFIIVLFEKATVLQLIEIANAGSKTGNYNTYSIEIHQKLEICMKNSNKSINDIKSAIDVLEQNVTPQKIPILDPSSLYAQQIISQEKNEHENTGASLPPSTSSSSLSLPSDYLSKILQEGNVFELVKSQMTATTTSTLSAPPAMPNTYISSNSMQNNSFNNQRNYNTNNFQAPPPNFQAQQMNNINNFQAPPPFNNSNNFQNNHFQGPPPINNDPVNASASEIEDVPELVPKKTIEYHHAHMMTFEEQLLEFKIFRVINYQHRQSLEIRETLKHIDIDKIIEKRKAVAQRKKILEYLKNAEKPEDTVSNPSYPKNWEVLHQERPPRKNKRKKAMTAKIRRVLAEKNRNIVKPMELEEISSESDDGFDSKPTSKNKPSNSQIFDELSDDEYGSEKKPVEIEIFDDEYSHITEKTIPDFNRFNHKKWVDIKELLWYPGRRKRPYKILIILRGVSGSGKSHLVKLIKRKESELGKASDIRILSIDDYFLAHDDDEEEKMTEIGEKEVNSYLDRMLKLLEKTLKDGFHSFIIIDAENCNLDFYEKFYNVGSSMGCSVYTIELYQTLEICKQQCCRNVSPAQMKESLKLMDSKRISPYHTLLIPTALYDEYKCFINPKLTQHDDEDDFQGDLDMLPSFNWHNRSTRSLSEILEGQLRYRRPRYIAILMRGPDTFNKILLSNMIVAKEKEMRNENINFINVEDLFVNQLTGKFEMVPQRHYDDNMRKITRKLRDIAQRKSIKFLIINTETGDFDHYLQIYNLMTSYEYRCYTIEVFRSSDKCATNDPYERSARQLESISEDFQLNATPDDHELLDASKFFRKNLPPEAKAVLENVKKDQPEEEEVEFVPTSSQEKTISLTKVRKCDERRTFESTQEEFQALFQRRFMVNGEFVAQNIKLPVKLPEFNWYNKDAVDIREFFENSSNRPQKIAIFIRGAPGSGKTYLANLIARKEIEGGNRDSLKILSLDKYFETAKYREVESSKYEKYIECNLNEAEIESYMEELSLELETLVNDDEKKYSMLIIDGYFCELNFYNRMWSIATNEGGYSGFTIELNQDDSICLNCNVHGWSKDKLLAKNNQMKEISTPDDHKLLDPEYLYDLYHYTPSALGDIFAITDDVSDDEDSDLEFSTINKVTSKWESLDTDKFERMDGTKNKTLRHQTMEEYLNTSEWTMRPSEATGKKRVRWADIEEKKAQERARDVGFIVGQTDWGRMMDNTDGRSALEKTKYIEPRRKN